jgi:hypothetical protein
MIFHVLDGGSHDARHRNLAVDAQLLYRFQQDIADEQSQGGGHRQTLAMEIADTLGKSLGQTAELAAHGMGGYGGVLETLLDKEQLRQGEGAVSASPRQRGMQQDRSQSDGAPHVLESAVHELAGDDKKMAAGECYLSLIGEFVLGGSFQDENALIGAMLMPGNPRSIATGDRRHGLDQR